MSNLIRLRSRVKWSVKHARVLSDEMKSSREAARERERPCSAFRSAWIPCAQSSAERGPEDGKASEELFESLELPAGLLQSRISS